MLTHYPLSRRNNSAFSFTTDQGIDYLVYFLKYDYMFEKYPAFSDNVYTFNIDVIYGDADESISDERIGLTIVEIFKSFFYEMKNVAIYVCDRLDDRQLARKRKFDWWFWKYNDGSIIKEDGIAVVEDVELINSLLIHRDNPHLLDIILAYKHLNDKVDEK